MGVHNSRELTIRQRAIHLAEEVYKIVADFPKEEKVGLTLQVKRCAVPLYQAIFLKVQEELPIKSLNNFCKFLWALAMNCKPG